MQRRLQEIEGSWISVRFFIDNLAWLCHNKLFIFNALLALCGLAEDSTVWLLGPRQKAEQIHRGNRGIRGVSGKTYGNLCPAKRTPRGVDPDWDELG
jgi:hypothetical protein